MEVIEEEELKRAIQQSLITQDENQQQTCMSQYNDSDIPNF